MNGAYGPMRATSRVGGQRLHPGVVRRWRIDVLHVVRIGHLDSGDRLGVPLDQVAAAEVEPAIEQCLALRARQHDRVAALPAMHGNEDLGFRQGQEGVDQEVDVGRLERGLIGQRHDDRGGILTDALQSRPERSSSGRRRNPG